MNKQTIEETLIEFPCRFPIKVMGSAQVDFAEQILAVIQTHAPDTQATQIQLRESTKGHYLSATVQVDVFSQEQLDNIYIAVQKLSFVKVVL